MINSYNINYLAPKYFLEAINDFNLNKKNIYNIGNTKSDMYAGYSAGIKRNFLPVGICLNVAIYFNSG